MPTCEGNFCDQTGTLRVSKIRHLYCRSETAAIAVAAIRSAGNLPTYLEELLSLPPFIFIRGVAKAITGDFPETHGLMSVRIKYTFFELLR